MPPQRTRAAEPALETTTVRFARLPVIYFAPQYVCEVLLRADGFTDVRYVDTTVRSVSGDLGRGKYDFASNLSLAQIVAISVNPTTRHARSRRRAKYIAAVATSIASWPDPWIAM